jgi:hypothetical protein
MKFIHSLISAVNLIAHSLSDAIAASPSYDSLRSLSSFRKNEDAFSNCMAQSRDSMKSVKAVSPHVWCVVLTEVAEL